MTDQELQVRAGLNVGNQPSLLTFLQKGGCKNVVVPPSGTPVVVLEGIESGYRTNYVVAVDSSFIANGSAQAYDWTTLFEDDQGNRVELESGSVAAAVGSQPGIDILEFFDAEIFFCLAPGEKLLLAMVPAESPPP
jgi:hypothetical protein